MAANISAMTWWQYVEHIALDETQERIARRIDVSTPTVSRWKTSSPKPETAAAFARAYGRPVVEAFIAAGFLTADDAKAQVTINRYEDPSDDQLLALISRRLRGDREAGEHGGDTATTKAPPSEPGSGGTVRRLIPDSKVEPPLRVAARRGRPASRPGETAGEESQDRGGFDPA